jgi:hypothetical protein
MLSLKNYFALPHRAMTALRACSDLSLADSFLARAFPPLSPPNLPNATAAGFFPFFVLERSGMSQHYRI